MSPGLISRIFSFKKNKEKRRSSVCSSSATSASVSRSSSDCSHKYSLQTPSSSESNRRRRPRMNLSSYSGVVVIDDLSPDDSVLDYTFISEEDFLLVILLTSNAELQILCQIGGDKAKRRNVSVRGLCGRKCDPVALALGPEAAFVVLALADGDILVLPMKLLLEVPWSAGQYFAEAAPVIITVPRSAELCLCTPTSIVCVNTIHAKRPVAIVANKAGQILVVDLSIRSLSIEMQAPQSVHAIEIIESEEALDLLVSGCTGAQWIVPLENTEESMRELLSRLVPTDLKQIEPAGSTLFRTPDGIAILNTQDNSVEVYQNLALVGGIPKRRFKVPTDSWLVHCSEKVVFTVSKQTDLRFAAHFGLATKTLDFTKIVPDLDWRILGFVPVSGSSSRMPACYLVNERGLVKIQPDNAGAPEGFAAEYLYKASVFSQSLVVQVAKKSGLEAEVLQKTLIPSLLFVRRGSRLKPTEFHRIIAMAKTLQTDMERLLELFAKNGIDEQLLPEVLRCTEEDKKSPLRKHVIELFVKKMEREGHKEARNKTDLELSLWLTRHSDITSPITPVMKSCLWRSCSLLALRSKPCQMELLNFVLLKQTEFLLDPDEEAKHQLLLCLLSLKWEWLDTPSANSLSNLLIAWSKGTVHHETCLRIAVQNADSFPEACSLLYIVSAMYLLSMKDRETPVLLCSGRPLTGGFNCSIVCGVDDKITVYGEMGSAQQKTTEQDLSTRRNSTPDGSPKHKIAAPRPVLQTTYQLQGTRPHIVSCGVEHILVLSTSNKLYSMGRNRLGQCGVGHDQVVDQITALDGDWPSVVSLSSGQYHSGLVLQDGSVYTWGWGMYGQLGHGREIGARDEWKPRKVEGLSEPMVSIVCGRVHTVLLSQSGRVYIAGGGTYGQLGLKKDTKKRFTFEPLSLSTDGGLEPKMVHISTKYYHTIAISDDSRIFEWGKNPQELKMKMFVMRRLRNSHVEKGEEGKVKPLPMDIPKDFLGVREIGHLLDGSVVCVSTGLSHSAVITDAGNLFTWGKSLDFQLGHGGKTERHEPHQVFEPANTQWVDVQCGGHFTMATSSDGRVFSWGRNDFGQCGLRSDRVPQSPRKLFFKAKEGVRRCVQLPDESAFVTKPQHIPDLICPIPMDKGELAEALDSSQLISRLRKCDLATLKSASDHFEERAPTLHSTAIAFLHLASGNVKATIVSVAETQRKRGTGDELSEDVAHLVNLIWDIVANHEDCHTEEILVLAFSKLPITKKVKANRQLRDLWPSVWGFAETQKGLTADEKANMLAAWTPSVQMNGKVQIDSSILKSSATRLRVWSECGHVEVPNESGECGECSKKWTESVREAVGQTL